MKITPVLHSIKALNFEPRSVWPSSLPAIIWQDYLIAGFQHSETAWAVHLNNEVRLETALFDLYPHMGWLEKARLVSVLEKEKVNFSYRDFFVNYQERYSEDLLLSLNKILLAPKGFQDWCEVKALAPRDWAPLKANLSWPELSVQLESLAQLNPSKSEGVRALEWLVDLILAQTDIPQASSWPDWYQSLYELRYPQACERQKALDTFLHKLPWPKNAEAKASQVGDRQGVEVKFFVQNKTDLEKQLAGLASVQKSWFEQNSKPTQHSSSQS